MTKTLHDLSLLEVLWLPTTHPNEQPTQKFMRVPGGWVYIQFTTSHIGDHDHVETATSVFIPYSKEFADAKPIKVRMSEPGGF